jgi:hypothetical protein
MGACRTTTRSLCRIELTAPGHPVMDAFDPATLPVAAGPDPAFGAGAHPL